MCDVIMTSNDETPKYVIRSVCKTLRHHFEATVLFKSSENWHIRSSDCKANPEDKNSSVIFTISVKSVLLYNFKLAYVVLHMAVKEFFRTHF